MSVGEAAYYFHEGTATEAYRFLGAHRVKEGDGYRCTFRVFAPGAESVSLVGDFCGWEQGMLMRRTGDGGIFEVSFLSREANEGSAYKYRITRNGKSVCKGDPYAFASRGGDDGASLFTDIPTYAWRDKEYMAVRRTQYADGSFSLPINIYEVHLGSFARHSDGSYLSYSELAEALLAYAKYMGYTHIELLPVTEYPYDASWGYQVCGYYAPTSRFGSPEEFCAFVDRLHAGGVGVILDWVPAHFPKDEWGLYEFDGAPLYEHSTGWRQESRSWGTRYFDLGRREVRSFLISSALFWLREYHIDGLRVDAVSSMLYLDYDRAEGEWEPNSLGTNIAQDAKGFLQALATAVETHAPGTLLIAEESGAYPGVTAPVSEGGLGFHFKWNMGFSNDLFSYLSASPEGRRRLHSALNFPITYAFSERYILPISHDEVVHGKGSFFGKMHGEYEKKMATYRAALLFMMTFPGKKLLFMGTEFGQPLEWNFDSSLSWPCALHARNDALREYVAALNRFYLSSPPLYERDDSEEGFSWLLADEAERELVAYVRRSACGEELVVLVSFSDLENRDVSVRVSCAGCYRAVFSTAETDKGEAFYGTEGAENTLRVTLPPASGLVLRRREDTVTL